MLQLYQFQAAWGLPNISPFCVKLETWLKMTGIQYQTLYENDTRKGPKGKIPFVVDDGEKIGDSTFIIEHLRRKHAVTLDDDLTPTQRAVAHAIERMLHDSLYWVLIHCRWVDDAGYTAVREALFGSMPAPLRLIVPGMIRRGVIKSAHGQGIGRHSAAEVMQLGCEDLDTLATLLGEQDYLFGADPHTVDATAFGFLMSFVGPPIDNDIKAHIKGSPALLAYYNRMRERFFPEVAAA